MFPVVAWHLGTELDSMKSLFLGISRIPVMGMSLERAWHLSTELDSMNFLFQGISRIPVMGMSPDRNELWGGPLSSWSLLALSFTAWHSELSGGQSEISGGSFE